MVKLSKRQVPKLIYTGNGISPMSGPKFSANWARKRLNRTARKRKSRRYGANEACEDSGRYRGTGQIRFRKRRVKGPTTKLRTKERADGFQDYVLEVHLKGEYVENVMPPSRHVYPAVVGAKGTSAYYERHRKPGLKRRRVSRFIAKDSKFTGEHDKIIEHLKVMMPVRARRTRKGRFQTTRLYFQSESDFTILKTLYGEQVWKAYRLIDKADA